MSATILVVEDEPKLAELLADYLRQAGFAPVRLDDGRGVVEWVREHRPELILLDLHLPGRDGLEICREIRAFSAVPILIVTARVDEVDRLLGLEFGADDYICKPFSPREVVARVKAVLRRSRGPAAAAAGLVLDETTGRALLHGHDLELTAVEFKLLLHLAGHPGRLFSRDQLMDRIYPDRRVVGERTIDSHIKKLRRKMNAVAPGAEFIHAVYGAGYRYEAAG